jgi:hypothetical protein
MPTASIGPIYSTANLPQYKDGMSLSDYAKQVQIAFNLLQAKINQTSILSIIYLGNTPPNGTQQVNVNGYLYATRVYNAVWNDLAEFMYKVGEAEPGDVLVQTDKGLSRSNKKGDKAVVGVYSDTYGYALGANNTDDKWPVGLAGVVSVKVKQKLKIGDLLISDKDGFATKRGLFSKGKVVGKVLEQKLDNSTSRIKVLIGI